MNDDRLARPVDAVFSLLDRQIIDVDGRMLGKVDDLELTPGDGLEITALLTGATAFLHRVGGRAGAGMVRTHVRLRAAEPHRDRPWRIPIEHVAYVDSAVHLSVPRDGLLVRDRDQPRLGTLAAMRVAGGRGRVIDARFEPKGGRLVLRSLLLGRGGPGSYLGYERNPRRGPWLVSWLVRRLHPHAREVAIGDVDIDWDACTITETQQQ